MISGYATTEGTKSFSEKFLTANYNSFQNLHLSNVGIGTYLGEPDSQTDAIVKDAVKKSILLAKSKLADRINGKMNNQSTINKSESGLNENNTLRSA
ncbi:MAG: aldo/keto reductase, partial [Thermoproteota archaeon]|nr:aldo/keto reductase [Thermoproteota archaeon]